MEVCSNGHKNVPCCQTRRGFQLSGSRCADSRHVFSHSSFGRPFPCQPVMMCCTLQTVRVWDREHAQSSWTCTNMLMHRHVPDALAVVSPRLILTTSHADVLLWRDGSLARRFSVPGQAASIKHVACMDGMVLAAADNSGEPPPFSLL